MEPPNSRFLAGPLLLALFGVNHPCHILLGANTEKVASDACAQQDEVARGDRGGSSVCLPDRILLLQYWNPI